MKPEIEAYLREHGARYTSNALRQQLIAAGHDATEVEEALRATEATRASEASETRGLRRRFWLGVLLLHVSALVIATVWILLGSTTQSYVGLAIVVLGIVLLIGVGVSGLIGGTLLGRGIGAALVVPAISALLLGGTCMAMAGPVSL